TTYYFCALGSNTIGNAVGTVGTFATPGLPTVVTSAATLVANTSATLNGSGNPRGAATTGWFRYGTTNPGTCTDTFGTAAPTTGGSSLGSGSSSAPFSQGVTGLTPLTTYYYCAFVSSSAGESIGAVASFATGGAPAITTAAPGSITATAATLNGSAVSN